MSAEARREAAGPTDVRPRVLVFFDYACPFCYLDWPRLKRLRAEHDAELVLVPVELRPDLPPGGASVAELGAEHSGHVREHMLRMAREGELELVFPDNMPNTHEALVLGEYARDLGAETHERMHEAIFSAYMGLGLDIGDRDVLLQIARDQGLEVDKVRAVLETRAFDDRLHQFHHLALSVGITATPAALVCNELFIGTRPYQVLAESLERCLVKEEDLVEEGAPPTIDR